MLFFSIIVPTLNRRPMIRSALNSIRKQAWRATEIVVVDGGSNDGTIEELSLHPEIRLITGPDRGVYDAVNIGLSHATGDVVGLLNSDDLYLPDTFSRVATIFDRSRDVDAACGTAAVLDGDRIVQWFSSNADKALSSPRTALIGSCMPNARFFRRAAMDQIGPFSLDYRYVADRDWLVRWYEKGLRTAAIPDLVYYYRQHAASFTFDPKRRNDLAIREELLKLALRWRMEPRASKETRRMATLLQGRCVATLAGDAALKGNLRRLTTFLFKDKDRLSVSPLMSVLRGGIDWLQH